VKRDEDTLINDHNADSIINNDTRDFWSEIKRLRSNKAGKSRFVDGQTENINIAKLFADKHRELYTSVPYESEEMLRIQHEIEDLILKNPMHQECSFNLCDVISAVSCLKSHKNDGGAGLNSDHIINAGDDCFTHIALLFSSFVAYGTVPDSFLRSSIVPILKGKHRTASDSSNFRGITLEFHLWQAFR